MEPLHPLQQRITRAIMGVASVTKGVTKRYGIRYKVTKRGMVGMFYRGITRNTQKWVRHGVGLLAKL